MKKMLAAIAALAIATTAQAQYHHHNTASEYYTAKSGDHVHRPMHAQHQPTGATAKCRDQTWSFSENHRGTCSHHGGVQQWLR